MKNAPPELPNPNDWTPPQLAEAAEQLHNAISIAARDGLPVAYLGFLKQYCEYLLLNANKIKNPFP